MSAVSAVDASVLPDYTYSHHAPIWWGVVGLLAIEATVFATLVTSFFYLQIDQPSWPPDGTAPPELLKPSIATLVLLLSSLPMMWADRSIQQGRIKPLIIGPLISVALAIVFLVMKAIEYQEIGFRWDSHAYGSIVWTMVGFHSVHVIVLILKTLVITTLAAHGYFDSERRIGVTVNGLYWHFVVLIWIPLYLTIYWASHWLAA